MRGVDVQSVGDPDGRAPAERTGNAVEGRRGKGERDRAVTERDDRCEQRSPEQDVFSCFGAQERHASPPLILYTIIWKCKY